jgi:class 3 adenylate cyclase
MTIEAATLISPINRQELDQALRKVWCLGANVIVGWRALPSGIKLLYLPGHALAEVAKAHPDLLEMHRQVTSDEHFATLVESGCLHSDISLAFELPKAEVIDELLRHYTITYCRCRAVALFDIVSFSLFSRFQQVAQLNMLTHYINLAASHCQRVGMPIDLSISSTGDGFYAWNRKDGLAADLALYHTSMLALAFNAAARQLAETESLPELRCGIHFGSHYEYYQAFGDQPDSSGFIVGDVTIDLARLVSAALANQLLIGSHTRHLSDSEQVWIDQIGGRNVDTPIFVALAQHGVGELIGIPLPGGEIASAKAYLTGQPLSAGEFSIKKYCVTDKHGLEHRCFNAKFNVQRASGEDVYVGLMEKNLDAFDARHLELEDIWVRIG